MSQSIPYRPLPPIQTVFASPAPPTVPKVESQSLSDEQIENWRTHLLTVVGPIALLLRREDIQRVRDEIQNKFQNVCTGVEKWT